MKVSLAPLQGYTDWVFRQAYQKHIGSIDEFYTPFLVLQNDGMLKKSHRREVELNDWNAQKLIPQFLCNTEKEFRFFEDYFSDLSYSTMNWNLGCPYPMVTKRGKGSGLLPFSDRIAEIVNESYQNKIELSVKLRLGLENDADIDSVLPVLKDCGVDEVIVHPRIGKQLYKGEVNLKKFESLYEKYGNFLAYNGDICNISDYESLLAKHPDLKHVMIGRGVLKDYWLPHKIKGIDPLSEEDKKGKLLKMHEEVYQLYASYLQGESQIIQKMKPFWEYFSFHFENDKKVYKAIKKSVSMKKYDQAVNFAFAQELKK